MTTTMPNYKNILTMNRCLLRIVVAPLMVKNNQGMMLLGWCRCRHRRRHNKHDPILLLILRERRRRRKRCTNQNSQSRRSSRSSRKRRIKVPILEGTQIHVAIEVLDGIKVPCRTSIIEVVPRNGQG